MMVGMRAYLIFSYLGLTFACLEEECELEDAAIDGDLSGSFIQQKRGTIVNVKQAPEVDGFDVSDGWCRREDGTDPAGSGTLQPRTVQECADYCSSTFYCKGFNVAPGVHQTCVIWGAYPAGGNNAWGWKCYVRHYVPPPDLFGYLPPHVGYCASTEFDHLQGLGTTTKTSFQDCADYCSLLTALRAPNPCQGFAFTEVTNTCNLFGRLPNSADGNDHWLCYAREQVVEIQLHGNVHADREDMGWFSVNGSLSGFQIYQRLQRPEWSHTLHCTNGECEPCWGSDSCWYMPAQSGVGHIGRFLSYDGAQGFTSFNNKVHIKCGAKMLWFTFVLMEVSNGRLQFFWDGQEINQANGFQIWPVIEGADSLTVEEYNYNNRGDNGFQGVAMIPVTRSGGHWFEMVFYPSSAGQESKAELASFQFFSTADYAKCQDNKMCMEQLLKDGSDYQQLRNSNNVQYACLNDPSPDPATACGEWRDCLDDSAELELKTMLASALPATAGSLSQVNKSVTDISDVDAHCINPETEDPQGWACDCFESMTAECERREAEPESGYTTQAACFTDLYCEHTEVCQHWAEAHCSQSSLLQRAQHKASQLQRAQHKASKVHDQVDSLDFATTMKGCG